MLDFWSRSSLYNLLFFLQRFLSHKLFVSVCSHMFFLRIILVEGSCFLYFLIGESEYTSVYTVVPGLRINMVAMCVQSKLRHMYMSKLYVRISYYVVHYLYFCFYHRVFYALFVFDDCANINIFKNFSHCFRSEK